MKISRPVQIAVGLAIAAAGVAIFLRDVNFTTLAHEIAKTSLWAIGLTVVLSITTLWLRGIRLCLLLPTTSDTHKKGLFANTVVGFMLNNILPARIGEAARVVLLWRQNKYRPFVGIGALLVERVWDIAIIGSFFVIPALMMSELSGVRTYAVLIGLGCISWPLLLVGHALFPRLVMSTGMSISRLFPRKIRPRLERILKELLSNLDWCRSPAKFAAIFGLSIIIELCYSFAVTALLGFDGMRSVLQGFFSQAFGAMGAAIPLSPGYVGTLHAFMLQGLTMAGVAEEKGRALTIVFHACNYIAVTALGLVLLMRMNLTLRDMSQSKDKLASHESTPEV